MTEWNFLVHRIKGFLINIELNLTEAKKIISKRKKFRFLKIMSNPFR